jgi:hypothetical protein
MSSLLQRLNTRGVNVAVAIQRGTLVLGDVRTFEVHGQ